MRRTKPANRLSGVSYFIAPSMTIFEARKIRTASGSSSNWPVDTHRRPRPFGECEFPKPAQERRRARYRHTRTPPTKRHLGATTTARRRDYDGADRRDPDGPTGDATRTNHSRRTIDDGVGVVHREDEKQRDDDIFHFRPPNECLHSLRRRSECNRSPARICQSVSLFRNARCSHSAPSTTLRPIWAPR